MNKICVITGGSSGLGFSLAKKMLNNRKNILIIGRDADKLIKAQILLQKDYHQNIYTIACDICSENGIKEIENFIVSRNLCVTHLFNNAGVGYECKIENVNYKNIEEVLNSNLKGMILITSKILQITPPDQELTIINVMSTSALVGRENESVYCASKWGARGFTEALKLELLGTKRNVIAIYPGGMKTSFWNKTNPHRNISSFMNPDDVAEKIFNVVIHSSESMITDITINRKK